MNKNNIYRLLPLLLILFFSSLFLIYSKRTDLLFLNLLEIVFVYGWLLLIGPKIRGFVWVLYCCILGAQIASVYSSGFYIVPLTLSNAGEYSALGSIVVIKLTFIIALFIITSLLIFTVQTKIKNFSIKILSTIVLFTTVYNFATPMHMFFDTFSSYYAQLTYKPSYDYPKIAKSYLKVNIWNDRDNKTPIKAERQNVIVIFTEGMSAAIIDKINNRQLHLTQNIDHLYDSSIVFENYYNHTAATFRGLRGQLTSAYQYKDGMNESHDGIEQLGNEKVISTYKNRLVSLPEILNKHGYQTYFLASTERNSGLNSMLKSMSFSRVYGMGDFKPYQEDRMTDKQTFAALKELLLTQQNQPFFIGVYPSGTHHGRDSPDLKYGDGKNSYYNKFYNYDAQLGDFIKYFDKSEYAKNTILILTADHSTFPTPEFKDSFGIKANYFFDQIPLIIHKVGVTSQKIDAGGYNSLSLTPTILQMLDINNEPNYFLGCSLFDVNCTSKFSNIGAEGDAYFKTSPEHYPSYNVEKISEKFEIKEFYNVSG